MLHFRPFVTNSKPSNHTPCRLTTGRKMLFKVIRILTRSSPIHYRDSTAAPLILDHLFHRERKILDIINRFLPRHREKVGGGRKSSLALIDSRTFDLHYHARWNPASASHSAKSEACCARRSTCHSMRIGRDAQLEQHYSFGGSSVSLGSYLDKFLA